MQEHGNRAAEQIARLHISGHVARDIDDLTGYGKRIAAHDLFGNRHQQVTVVALAVGILIVDVFMACARIGLRLLPVQCLGTRAHRDPLARQGVVHPELPVHIHRHAADLVDDRTQIGKADFRIMADGSTRHFGNRTDDTRRPFPVVGLVDLHQAAIGHAVRGIPGNGDDRHLIAPGVDTQEHDHIGPFAIVGRGSLARIRPQDQRVIRLPDARGSQLGFDGTALGIGERQGLVQLDAEEPQGHGRDDCQNQHEPEQGTEEPAQAATALPRGPATGNGALTEDRRILERLLATGRPSPFPSLPPGFTA